MACLQDCLDVVIGATASLTNLSHLVLFEVPLSDMGILQHLPASLHEMDVRMAYGRETVFSLAHLTAVTRMHSIGWQPIRLQEGDVLPPNLEVLQLFNDDSIRPVLALHRLRELTMYGLEEQAAQLEALSNLQALTAVRLLFSNWGPAVQGAAAYSKIPLVTLSAGGLFCRQEGSNDRGPNLPRWNSLARQRV